MYISQRTTGPNLDHFVLIQIYHSITLRVMLNQAAPGTGKQVIYLAVFQALVTIELYDIPMSSIDYRLLDIFVKTTTTNKWGP